VQTDAFLESLAGQRFFRGQIVHVEDLPEREPVSQELDGGLHASAKAALNRRGIERLYSHQATAVEKVRQGENVVVVTGTASGKTLCYTIPVLDALLADSKSTMLFVYPTKALAQDQLRGLRALQSKDQGVSFVSGTYDGDTSQGLRRKLRSNGNVILTNPDMLHQGILPHHARWNRFFSHLRYIVIDEVHAYRGVFGSHLANVMRRVGRICRHYGAAPQFICSSATIANPKGHAERVCGVPMTLVDNDGAPRGPKRFVFWNPPSVEKPAGGGPNAWRVGGQRRSAIQEAVELMSLLVQDKVQTIAFVRTRLTAELILRSCREKLRTVSNRLADAVYAYRGGYLPEERRAIERKLGDGEILGVSSTNALELGIDIGSLDACIMVGYPGTVASLWQQAGRAGRGREESMVFLVAQNSPMDQYLMAHTDYILAQNPEQAVVDPDNPHIAVGHLKCAAYELPLSPEDAEGFGPYAEPVLDLLEEERYLRRVRNHWYWASSEYPAAAVNLRNISGTVYTIQDESRGERIVGTMDEVSAFSQLHDHAVYLHRADTYFVTKLDIDQKVAHVERRDLDYYTQAAQTSEVRVDGTEREQTCFGGLLGYGDVTVTTTISCFKKMRFHSRDSLGFEELDLPPQTLETVAFWFAPPEPVVVEARKKGVTVNNALIGIANVLVEVAPFYVMCDTKDIGTVVDSRNLKREAVFLHDRYPGGMGYASRCFDSFEEILATIAEIIHDCGCEDGCPSCVGSPMPSFAMSSLDSGTRGVIPTKDDARFLLDALL
jgi:DEAD/DEAH box helicase domain-containing protein